MVYLILKNASGFISFTEKAFGAKLSYKHMSDENSIQHGEIMIDECTIMFADATPEYKEKTAGFFIYVNDADETFKKAIEAGATVITEMADKSYGRSGGVRDPFGVEWWITTFMKSA
jgi:uncharacterized glyoxalase superfamily protein PhnB